MVALLIGRIKHRRLICPPRPLHKTTPHIAIEGRLIKIGRRRKTRIHRRTTHHSGWPVSQRMETRIEESFGWIKTTTGFAKTRHRGLDRIGWMFTLAAAACILVQLLKMLMEAVP